MFTIDPGCIEHGMTYPDPGNLGVQDIPISAMDPLRDCQKLCQDHPLCVFANVNYVQNVDSGLFRCLLKVDKANGPPNYSETRTTILKFCEKGELQNVCVCVCVFLPLYGCLALAHTESRSTSTCVWMTRAFISTGNGLATADGRRYTPKQARPPN